MSPHILLTCWSPATRVIGEQPVLKPGASHSYSSWCPLKTAFGTMEGTYQMVDEDEREFDIRIGRFYLAVNAQVNSPEE